MDGGRVEVFDLGLRNVLALDVFRSVLDGIILLEDWFGMWLRDELLEGVLEDARPKLRLAILRRKAAMCSSFFLAQARSTFFFGDLDCVLVLIGSGELGLPVLLDPVFGDPLLA